MAKYLLNPSLNQVVEESELAADTDTVGEFDITTRCGQCGEYDYTRIDTLLEDQKGIVNCSGCGKHYVAQSHLTANSNPISKALLEQALKP